MENKRKAKNISYADFLTGTTPDIEDYSSPRLSVAFFQRNYTWTRKNIIPLIESIDENDPNFFLGNLVIQSTGKRDLIIDGQQRLVTLSLILSVLKSPDISSKTQETIDDLLFDSKRQLRGRVDFSREKLRSIYQDLLKGNLPDGDLDATQKKLLRNYTLIKKEIKRRNIDPEKFIEKIKSLEFIVIKCFNEQEVHQLFEGLNSKGKKLSAVELTKNALLSAAGDQSADQLTQTQKLWESVESEFEKTNAIWFDKFLRQQWFYIGGYVSNEKLFPKIKGHISAEQGKFMEYSSLLESDSKIYIALRRAEGLDEVISSAGMETEARRKVDYLVKNIKSLQVDQVYAVLLALIKYGNSNSEYLKRDHLFKDIDKIWSFLLLVKYSNISPSSYEQIFANFCKGIGEKMYSSSRKTFFANLGKKIPKREDFVETMNERILCTGKNEKQITFQNDRELIKFLLLTYLSRGDQMVPEKLTIDHIIPTGSLANWKEIAPRNHVEVEISRCKLGNLSLLPPRINSDSEVGNMSFTEKYEKAYKNDKYVPNREIIKYKKEFASTNPTKAVVKRGKEIAQELYEILSEKVS